MDNKGVISIVVLWVLLFLSLIAWSLGRRSSMEVTVVEAYQGKLRSYAAARAGVNYILDLLQRSPSSKDTLYSTGIGIDQTKSPEDIFARIDVGKNTHATVGWPASNFNTADSSTHFEYGISDEEGRINVNAVGIANYQVLSALLELKGLSSGDADKLAKAVVNYTGINAAAGDNGSFMNNALLKPKNKPYENILELLEVDGMTQDIFDKIKDDLTVYGNSQQGLWINMDTASNDVIQAVANAASRVNPSINPADIVAKAYTVRDGADGQSFTSDDGTGSLSGVNNPNWPVALQEGKSNYYRVRVTGIDGDSGKRTVLEAVIHQGQGFPGKVVSWQRD